MEETGSSSSSGTSGEIGGSSSSSTGEPVECMGNGLKTVDIGSSNDLAAAGNYVLLAKTAITNVTGSAISGGDVWKASISRAVRECDAFLVVLSPQSANSENVSKELAVATKHARRVLPVMYQACRIPDKMEYDLAELHWADFVEPEFDEALVAEADDTGAPAVVDAVVDRSICR